MIASDKSSCLRCARPVYACWCRPVGGGPALPEEARRELERLFGRDPAWSEPEMVEYDLDLGPAVEREPGEEG